MTWFIVLIVVVLLYGLLWLGSREPVKAPLSGLAKYLEVLLNRGNDRAFMLVKPGRGVEFIQFSKYMGESTVGLQFDFPLAPWSESYYDELQSILRRAGFDYERQAVSNGDTKEFVVVDLKKDHARAAELARLCLTDLFGCTDEHTLRTCDPQAPMPPANCRPQGDPEECTFCGDGNMEASEGCDDGNNVDGDGCSANCTVEVPTLGHWGVIILTLVLLVLGVLVSQQVNNLRRSV